MIITKNNNKIKINQRKYNKIKRSEKNKQHNIIPYTTPALSLMNKALGDKQHSTWKKIKIKVALYSLMFRPRIKSIGN